MHFKDLLVQNREGLEKASHRIQKQATLDIRTVDKLMHRHALSDEASVLLGERSLQSQSVDLTFE